MHAWDQSRTHSGCGQNSRLWIMFFVYKKLIMFLHIILWRASSLLESYPMVHHKHVITYTWGVPSRPHVGMHVLYRVIVLIIEIDKFVVIYSFWHIKFFALTRWFVLVCFCHVNTNKLSKWSARFRIIWDNTIYLGTLLT